MMSQACTIYTREKYNKILDYLVGEAMRYVSDSSEKTFERNYFEGKIRITLKQQIEQGDSFSNLLRGTWNFFENIETKNKEEQKQLTNRILETKTAIGIIAEPEFTETDKRLDLVFKLTELFDGIIFNGSAMLNKNGQIILDNKGKSE